MKKWNDPKVSMLGVENTKEGLDDCTCTPTTFKNDKNTHYCHATETWHENGCGHNKGGGVCPTKGEHPWDGEPHKSACCCGGLS